jgi:hypothetical protein
MPDSETALRWANETIAEAQRFVHEQKGKIIRLKPAGRDMCDAEKTLQLFESNLKVLEDTGRCSKEPRNDAVPARWRRVGPLIASSA